MSETSVIAERIARAHNDLRAALLRGGVLVFSPAAYSVEPAVDGVPGLDLDRLPFPCHDREVTVDEVQAWLDEYRDHQATAREQIEREREEAAMRHSMRVGAANAARGYKRRGFQCPSCKRFKSRPSAQCGHCGDEMGEHNMTEAERRQLDRDHGWAA